LCRRGAGWVTPERYSNATIEAIRGKLDGTALLRELGANGEVEASAEELRSFCPICRDTSKMTLVAERDTNRAYCTNLTCAGSSMNSGGNAIKYFAVASGLGYDQAVERLATKLGVPLEEAAKGAAPAGAEDFRFIEVAHLLGHEGEALAVPIQFAGHESPGRGLYIQLSQLDDFAQRYRSQVFRSQFLYSTNSAADIARQAADRSLVVLGDYYIVFRSLTSSETVHAINQAIDLVERLKDAYNVPYEAVTVYYAGQGIEVQVDSHVFGIRPSPRLPEIYRRMSCALLGVDPSAVGSELVGQADLSAYHADYLTNIPGTTVSSEGREVFKIRMSYAAFKKLSYQRLNEFTQRRPDLPPREPFTQVSPRAREFYTSIATSLERDTRAVAGDFIVSSFYDPTISQGMSTLRQLAPALLKRLFDENRQVLPTISPHLDRCLAGGFHPGELYVLAGFPGSGTSTMALQMMNHAAKQEGVHCFLVGLQRGVEELFKRSLSQIGRIPVWEIDQKRQVPNSLFEDKDFNRRIFGAVEAYKEYDDRIVILEGAAAANLSQLTKMLRDKREELRGRDLHDHSILLVIDSLQLMVALLRSIWSERSIAGEREFTPEISALDVQTLAGRLKALARELDVAVLCTLEFYGRTRDMSAEAVGCSEEVTRLFFDTQFADTVMMLCRQGRSLAGLSGALKADMEKSALRGNGGKSIEKLAALERKCLESPEFTELGSEFVVLDILKNRTGPADKLAFAHHKVFTSFEPLDYQV
jgi:replicative DNA helicase